MKQDGLGFVESAFNAAEMFGATANTAGEFVDSEAVVLADLADAVRETAPSLVCGNGI